MTTTKRRLTRTEVREAFRECPHDKCKRYADHKGDHGDAVGRRWPR